MTDIDRRTLLSASAGLAATAQLASGAQARPAASTPDLFIGTGGHGHTYPGATLPFGMVQLSPDTDIARWDACSGYHRSDTSIMGFSHTHLSGTGIGDMLDVLVVPARGPVQLQPGPLDDPDAGYRQRFSHESAEPGFYRVTLESGIQAELTATERTGYHRYRFPSGPGHILIDLAHMPPDSPGGHPLVRDAHLWWDAERQRLMGGRQVFRWAAGRHIHFALELSRAPDRVQLFGDDDRPMPPGAVRADGQRLKAVLFFNDAGAAPILIRCGISAVDAAGALANLQAEAEDWAFDRVRRDAARTWSKALGTVAVSGGTPAQRTIMASALYHAQLAPTLFTDTDGRTVGLDQRVHQLAANTQAFSSYSLWDTYRALHPLLTLIAPDRARAFVADLARQTAQSPYGPPVWPLQAVETGCMVGWHSVVVMAEAIAKGIDADYAAAWPAIRKRAFDPAGPDLDNSLGRPAYFTRGWIPADETAESVSHTLEFAYDDWAMAAIADHVGAHDDARVLRARSRNYRNLFDGRVGFMRPRLASGGWTTPFDPIEIGHSKRWRDYTESNAWQATFLNQHDLAGLIALFGGDAAFAAKLDALFAAPSVLPPDAPPDISGLLGQYAHGNEPSHHIAYLYAFAGQPWKTQALVRRLLTEMYHADPDGVIGNDDCGQMSAWFVLSALGFYPVDPVSAVYVFGSPLFDRAEVQLGDRRRLVVEAIGNAPDRPYVQSVSWNGRPWTKGWISHRDLAAGGRLRFLMGAAPNKAFASAPAVRPPSFGHLAA